MVAMSVEVAVIPCAGAGTRMRPATRVIPKPMIPVVDRPVVQYVVEEAVAAGVREIILVVDERPGDPVLGHFTQGDPIEGLEGVEFRSVVQSNPHGLGDAVARAAPAVGDRPFLCLLPDRFPVPGAAAVNRMVQAFDGGTVLAVREVSADDELGRYGVVAIGRSLGDDLFEVTGAVEKPGADLAPSRFAIVGRYIFPYQIFAVLESLPAGRGGEIQLTDAIDLIAREQGASGVVVSDGWFDTGVPAGLLEATATVGLSRGDLGPQFREVLTRLLATDEAPRQP